MFEGVSFRILPVGSLKGPVRRRILTQRLTENGAEENEHGDDKLTCILASHEADHERLRELIPNGFEGHVIDVAWVTDSLSNRSRQDPKHYIINFPEKSTSQPANKKHAHEHDEPNAPLKGASKDKSNEKLATLFDELESLASTSRDRRDAFRAMSYRKAAAVVREFPRTIRTEEDTEELRSQLGEKTIEKIKEFVRTGKIEKAEIVKSEDHEANARKTLTNIWGVGPAMATELIRQGFDSIEKLRESGEYLLNDNQKTGLKFYEELLSKMPRTEVEKIASFVENVKTELFGDSLEMITCGSYRRNSTHSHDADLLFSWRAGVRGLPLDETLHRVIEALKQRHFIVDHFNKKNHHTVFMGICRLDPKSSARRFDMKIWPRESLACALLHFTGNADFNRRLRLHARRHGFKLSDSALTKANGVIVPCSTEEDVFANLGVQFVPPSERTSAAELRSIGSTKAQFKDETLSENSDGSD